LAGARPGGPVLEGEEAARFLLFRFNWLPQMDCVICRIARAIGVSSSVSGFAEFCILRTAA